MSRSGHEFELIDQIRRGAAAQACVLVGIGDDAAVLSVGDAGSPSLVTTDVLMEGVHFDLAEATPAQAGRKALAVSFSDIAAMAGRPTAAFVGLALPKSRGITFAEQLMQGMQDLADEFDVAVAGGDTNIWDGPAVISVTLLGEPTGPGPVLRSGAQPGDWLMVTGQLGGSLVQGRHLTFAPRVREAEFLNKTFATHAMIDLSDGLASDVQHLLRESAVGGEIYQSLIPVHPDVDQSLPAEESIRHALSDGEDFELLLAVSPDEGQQLIAEPIFDTPITKIGTVTEDRKCWFVSDTGERSLLEPTGWEHRFGERLENSE